MIILSDMPGILSRFSRDGLIELRKDQEIYSFYFRVSFWVSIVSHLWDWNVLKEYCRETFPKSSYLIGSGPRSSANIFDVGCCCIKCSVHECNGLNFEFQIGRLFYPLVSESGSFCGHCRRLVIKFVVHNALVMSGKPYNSLDTMIQKLDVNNRVTSLKPLWSGIGNLLLPNLKKQRVSRPKPENMYILVDPRISCLYVWAIHKE